MHHVQDNGASMNSSYTTAASNGTITHKKDSQLQYSAAHVASVLSEVFQHTSLIKKHLSIIYAPKRLNYNSLLCLAHPAMCSYHSASQWRCTTSFSSEDQYVALEKGSSCN